MIRNLRENTRFLDVNFEGRANFSDTRFYGKVKFDGTQFSETKFSASVEFKNLASFRNVIFENQEKVSFDLKDMQNVAFLNTDTSRVKFADKVDWGGDDGFTIADERELISKFEDDTDNIDNKQEQEELTTVHSKNKARLVDKNVSEGPSIDEIRQEYRNLRENYEYRLKYDEAGQLFIKEMELKRKYRDKPDRDKKIINSVTIKNHPIRQIFSITGLYYIISKYGESLIIPMALFSAIIFLSTLFWLFLAPYLVPAYAVQEIFRNCNEYRILCSFERTLQDIVGFPEHGIIVDYVTRITSIIILGILFIPLRRQFERKFRH